MQQPAAQDPLIGAKIGNYEVRSKIGEGGMGAVFMAEHPGIGKQVALKVLHPEFTHNEDVSGRFFDEARAVNDIGHPNIVDIVDYGTLEQGGKKTTYFIMEYLDGPSLSQLIKRDGALEPPRAMSIAFQIADALNASHQHGIVHRDLKPDNIMLIRRGRERDFVKVLDFGIAKLTHDNQPSSRKTRTGVVMGTPQYMSPEQCDGAGFVDHRTDIYAVGILLFEMLTAQPPFQGNGFSQILMQQLMHPPPRPASLAPNIDPHVEAVVLKALAKNPDDRYPNMEELMKAIANPVGYIQQLGGIESFMGAPLVPTGGPMPHMHSPIPGQLHSPIPGQLHSPIPGQLHTPMPGQIYSPARGRSAVHGPAPGHTPPPGSLGGHAMASGAYKAESSAGGGRRIGLIVAIVALLLGGGAAAYIGLLSGDSALVKNEPGGAPSDTGGSESPGSESPDSDPVVTGAGTVVATSGDGSDGDGSDGSGGAKSGEGGAVVPDDDTTRGDDGTTGDAEGAEPTTVSIRVLSRPKGAKVYVNDEKEPRGTTPHEIIVEKSDVEMSLSIERDGYKTETRAVTPTVHKEFDLQLEKRKRVSRRGKKDRKRDSGGKKGSSKGGEGSDFTDDTGLLGLEE